MQLSKVTIPVTKNYFKGLLTIAISKKWEIFTKYKGPGYITTVMEKSMSWLCKCAIRTPRNSKDAIINETLLKSLKGADLWTQ